jgi:hypothetical protein
MRSAWLILVLWGAWLPLSAQQYWQNGSFEGQPQDATIPVGWLACQPGTTPDILPGFWGVYQDPSEGNTYLGLITREDGSWESIGQRLSRPIPVGKCFSFSIDLAHARTYSGYNQPIRLRIWGGDARCSQRQLLYESPEISHSAWRTYPVIFTAKQPIVYIAIEAYSPRHTPRRGNILLDNMKPLRPCPRAELPASPAPAHANARS